MLALGNTNLEVSPLCLGGNVFGWTADRATSFQLLDEYVAGGGNFIDTADSYSQWADGNEGGESEAILGAWLARRGRADDLVIATKVGMWDLAPGLSARNVTAGVDASLKRLGVDRIDLFYAHIDDETVPFEETLGALGEQIAAGKIGAIGASNHTAPRLGAALKTARDHRLPSYQVLQTHYNLVHRHEFEDDLAGLCAREQIPCVAYAALADGFLTGKYRRGQPMPASERVEDAEVYLGEAHDEALKVLEELAQRHGTAMATVALAWLAAKPAVIPLASARTPEQLQSLMHVLDLELAPSEVQALDAATSQLRDMAV